MSGQNVTFPPGSSAGDEVCASILICSDNILEVSEAIVNVEVFPRQFGDAIVPVERQFAHVTIVDANSKQLVTKNIRNRELLTIPRYTAWRYLIPQVMLSEGCFLYLLSSMTTQ